jgi:hypothetical protein
MEVKMNVNELTELARLVERFQADYKTRPDQFNPCSNLLGMIERKIGRQVLATKRTPLSETITCDEATAELLKRAAEIGESEHEQKPSEIAKRYYHRGPDTDGCGDHKSAGDNARNPDGSPYEGVDLAQGQDATVKTLVEKPPSPGGLRVWLDSAPDLPGDQQEPSPPSPASCPEGTVTGDAPGQESSPDPPEQPA